MPPWVVVNPSMALRSAKWKVRNNCQERHYHPRSGLWCRSQVFSDERQELSSSVDLNDQCAVACPGDSPFDHVQRAEMMELLLNSSVAPSWLAEVLCSRHHSTMQWLIAGTHGPLPRDQAVCNVLSTAELSYGSQLQYQVWWPSSSFRWTESYGAEDTFRDLSKTQFEWGTDKYLRIVWS